MINTASKWSTNKWRFFREHIPSLRPRQNAAHAEICQTCTGASHRQQIENYSLFAYFGSSTFFWFLLHNESLWRNCLGQLMCCTSTFWKCVWFENFRSITKVMSVEVENVPWRFCSFLHVESSDGVSEELLPISTLSYSRLGSCSPSAFYALSHSLSKCWRAFCHARGWRTNDLSHAAFTQTRPNGAKIMAPRWRHGRAKVSHASKQNETSQNHNSLLQELDCCRFEPERRFWSAFQFPGTRNKWMHYNKNNNNNKRYRSISQTTDPAKTIKKTHTHT